MTNISPEFGASGRFTLREPYALNTNILYSVIAKRSFADCERRGDDVYQRYYQSQGLVDGDNGFSFDTERGNGVQIITLQGQDGSFYWVPSSYIATWPDVSEVTYHQHILTCSLGALPEGIEYDAIIDELQDVVLGLTGIADAEVDVIVSPVTLNPTTEEHLDMERTRLGNITINTSIKERFAAVQNENTELRNYISQLESILRANNITN